MKIRARLFIALLWFGSPLFCPPICHCASRLVFRVSVPQVWRVGTVHMLWGPRRWCKSLFTESNISEQRALLQGFLIRIRSSFSVDGLMSGWEVGSPPAINLIDIYTHYFLRVRGLKIWICWFCWWIKYSSRGSSKARWLNCTVNHLFPPVKKMTAEMFGFITKVMTVGDGTGDLFGSSGMNAHLTS